MKWNWRRHSAYQGRGWRRRERPMRSEIAKSQEVWSPFQVNCEWSPLTAVALHLPGREIGKIREPASAQHLRRLNLRKLRLQLNELRNVFKKLGVEILDLAPRGGEFPPFAEVPPNLMFARDLLFSTPEGCVVARMASEVRAGEEKFASAALAGRGVPIRLTVGGRGLFEGADALWVTPKTVAVGVGNRTNQAGFVQLRTLLNSMGVSALAIPLPAGVQHLLGLLQIPGPRLALIREEIAPRALLRLLTRNRFRMIGVRETSEVVERQGLNFVTVAPRRIVMATGCPDLKRVYKMAGLTIAAELEISELCGAAGGLACATGIVGRKQIS